MSGSTPLSVSQVSTYAQQLLINNPHVRINEAAYQTATEHMRGNVGGFKPNRWTGYVGEHADYDYAFNYARTFFEFALNSAQQAGFIYEQDGRAMKWEKNGSGGTAMTEALKAMRDEMGVLGKDFYISRTSDNYQALKDKILGTFFKDIPFKEKRFALLEEFGRHDAYGLLNFAIIRGLRGKGFETQGYDFDANTFRINATMAAEIGKVFPKSFQEDPFRKKLILTCILAASNIQARHNQHPECFPSITLEGMSAAADYRLPQTLMQLGMIQASPALTSKLENKELMDENSDEVIALRAACVVVTDRLVKDLGIPLYQLDYLLWKAPRDEDLMKALGANDNKKPIPHMMVQTLRF